jgi:hypothetical protein
MRTLPALTGALGLGMTLSCTAASGQSAPDLDAALQAMRQQLEQQRARIDALERQLGARPAAAPVRPGAASARLDDLRGMGSAADPAPGPAAVGPSPQDDARAPAVAPIFESPGVLTPRGHLVVEPSVQYGYSSSNRVAVVGYTVIPALLIGLLDVREVKRNTTTVATALRYGVGNRLEAEARLPWVYRSDSTVSREIFTGTAAERAFDASGKGIGDAEAALRYQLNDGGADRPYYIAGLRYKTRTGRDPFEVVTDCQTRCVGANVTGTGLPLTLPTGSGFRSLQPSLTWMLPSDPAVFFGSFSYTRNFARRDVYRTILAGQREPLGTVKAGDVFGFNLGMGLALNDNASLSFGYDHSSVGRSRQNGQVIPGSVRIQLGTLLIGASYRLDPHRSVSVSIGAGLTRDTPDVTLTVRLPFGL